MGINKRIKNLEDAAHQAAEESSQLVDITARVEGVLEEVYPGYIRGSEKITARPDFAETLHLVYGDIDSERR